jgi:hypothetical protein
MTKSNPTGADRQLVRSLTTALYESTAKFFTEAELEVANEAAIELIANAGFDHSDSDVLGDECEGELHTLLVLALLRRPELDDQYEGTDSDYTDESTTD